MNTDAVFTAVERDRELEAAANSSTEELARHRWHWTLDGSNPDRVKIPEYAKRVGRAYSVIHAMVKGYDQFSTAQTGTLSLSEALARTAVGAERAEVIEAVAAATGQTFQNVQKHEKPLTRSIQTAARERAERKGTTISEELPRAAQATVAARRAAENERTMKRASKSHVRLVLEGHLASMALTARYAIRDSKDSGLLTDDDRAYLGDVIAHVRTMLDLLDLGITDSTDVDWDAELAKLGES